jgi:hypothetical protein
MNHRGKPPDYDPRRIHFYWILRGSFRGERLMLTFRDVDEQLHYDDETGLLIRKKRSSSSVKKCDVAGHKKHDGYITVRVKGRPNLAHRVIWLLKTGSWPTGEIDHIDGDPSNNRFENLRQVDHRTNGMNLRLYSTNKSGMQGVSWHSQTKKWKAQINDDNGKRYLGCFISIEDAISARKAAEIELGYHTNHGRIMEEKD